MSLLGNDAPDPDPEGFTRSTVKSPFAPADGPASQVGDGPASQAWEGILVAYWLQASLVDVNVSVMKRRRTGEVTGWW